MNRIARFTSASNALALAVGLAGCQAEMVEEEGAGPLPDQILLADPSTVEAFERAAEASGDYAGLWVEGEEEGQPTIYIARTSAAFEAAFQLTDAEVVFVDADYSLGQLNAELEQVLAADRADDRIAFGAHVDPRRNRVVVQPELAAPEVLTDHAEVAGRLGVDPAMLIVDEPIRVSTTSIAGGYYAAGGCTGGFPVKKSNGAGGYYYGLLTAGHCSNSSFSATSCNYYSASYSAVTAGGVDRQVHRAASGSCSPTRRLSNGVYYNSGYSSGYTGQSIRRYGLTTGTRSGTIYILNWYYAGTDGPWILSSTGLNCQGGDSGGPWYTSGAWPLGITRGTTGDRCFASKIGYALYGTGYSIF
jgi:streptogrisin B